MTIIKLTDKEAKIIRTILGNLADQIDEEIVNVIPNDITESDQFLDDTRATLAKLY